MVAVQHGVASSGWEAKLELGFEPPRHRPTGESLSVGDTRSRLVRRRHQGPLTVQRPFYPEGGTCHVYVLHPPGGIVGGDTLSIDVDVGAGAEGLVTTPGAGKFYRSAGTRASQTQTLHVGAGGAFEWFPLENIFFPGALVDLRTEVVLEADARFALWEISCFGRPVANEQFDFGNVTTRLSMRRGDTPILIERQRIDSGTFEVCSLMHGYCVNGTFVITNANEDALSSARDAAEVGAHGHVGLTLLDDVLVARYLGNSTEMARRLFTRIWTNVRPLTFGRVACLPRIWAT